MFIVYGGYYVVIAYIKIIFEMVSTLISHSRMAETQYPKRFKSGWGRSNTLLGIHFRVTPTIQELTNSFRKLMQAFSLNQEAFWDNQMDAFANSGALVSSQTTWISWELLLIRQEHPNASTVNSPVQMSIL